MITGSATAIKIGVAIEMTIKIATTLKSIQIQLRIIAGKKASMTSVSLENLFMMRPEEKASCQNILV